MRDAMDRIPTTSTSVRIGKRCKTEVSSTSACLVPTTGWYDVPTASQMLPDLHLIQPNAGHGRGTGLTR